MNYRSRVREAEPIGRFKDLIFVECFPSGDGKVINFEPGELKRANRVHGREKRIEGVSAVVVVYPAMHAMDFVLTKSTAKRVAIGYMTGEGVTHVDMRT